MLPKNSKVAPQPVDDDDGDDGDYGYGGDDGDDGDDGANFGVESIFFRKVPLSKMRVYFLWGGAKEHVKKKKTYVVYFFLFEKRKSGLQ